MEFYRSSTVRSDVTVFPARATRSLSEYETDDVPLESPGFALLSFFGSMIRSSMYQ